MIGMGCYGFSTLAKALKAYHTDQQFPAASKIAFRVAGLPIFDRLFSFSNTFKN